LLLCGVCVVVRADDPHAVAAKLAGEKRFDAAAAVYRDALTASPRDWRLRLGLARVTLWSGRYRDAERQFASLLADKPADGDALLGYAQAAYWAGDFRAAGDRYRALLAAQPGHAEAQKVLSELAALAAPRYGIEMLYRDDSQPYDIGTASATVSLFSDPLTRWDIRGSAGSAGGASSSIGFVGAGLSTGLPDWRLHVDAHVERFQFPDGETGTVGGLAVTRTLPWRSAVVASVERTPLLYTATSVAAHVTATDYSLTWRRDPSERWLASIAARRIDYSDGNDGEAADAWMLVPVYSRGRLTLRAGASAAWRDTSEDRFRFTQFSSRQIAAGEWAYTFHGVYDPYWTPQDLREARVLVVAETPRVKVHLDGGYAEDRAVSFGPSTGPSPGPLFIFPVVLDRSFRPWRAGIELNVPVTRRIEFRARYRHDVTAFYRANEIEASLGGRL
jgi:hypothetical protein